MNDWSIWKFIVTVMALLAGMLLVIGLELDNVDLPLLRLLRPVLAFVCLAFVPGMLILRALKIHGLGSAATGVYAVGLSLTTVILVGLFLNTVLPLTGYEKPLTLLPLTAAMVAFVLAMCAVCYIRDRHYAGDAYLDLPPSSMPVALLLVLLPFLAVFGTYLMNGYSDNVLLLAMIAAIAVVVLAIGFGVVIPRELFTLAIFVIALSLLFHNSLISDSLIGWDIHQEKYLADSVIENGYWNASLDHVINSMLSIMMLAPILSILMDMNTIWVYKVVFPLLFALVPVALYLAYRRQSDGRIAFFSAFFFMSLVVFFSEMLQLARQEIAELFLALIILLIVDRRMAKAGWSVLFVLFSVSLVMSHYALTFIFIGTLALAWGLLYVVSKLQKNGLKDTNRKLTAMLIVFLVGFCGVWYIHTSNSNPMETVVAIADRMEEPIVSVVSDILAPAAPVTPVTPTAAPVTPTSTPGSTIAPTPKPAVQPQPLEIIETGGSVSRLHRMFLYLIISTQGLLVIGILTALWSRWPMNIRREFYSLAIVNLLMLAIALVLPYFASALNTTRLYQIALIVLAPFFVLGWINIFKAFGTALKRSRKGTLAVALAALSIFMVCYLIFNTGLVFQIARDVPMSYSLDSHGDNVSFTIYNSFELAGAEWMLQERDAVAESQNMTYVPPIFSDTYRQLLLQDWNASRSYLLPSVAATTPPGAYVYLGTFNVLNGWAVVVMSSFQQSQVATLVNISSITGTRNRIYSNGGSEVYY